NPKAATVTADNQSKTYGAADPVFTFQTTGLVSPDTLTGVSCGVSGAHANAGSYGITCAGNTNANYSVTYANGSLSVTKRALVIGAADKTKIYGDANATATRSISGDHNGDAVTVSFSTGGDAASGVGSYAVVPHANCTDAVLANYDVQPTNGSLSVTKRALVISAADKTKVYGDANPTFTGSISGVQNGDAVTLSFSTGADATSGVGSYAIVPHANGTDAVLANYDVQPTNGSLSVTKRALVISAADKTKVYGDANPTFTGSISGVQNGDAVTLSFSTGADATSGVGSYAIVPHANGTDAVLANYDVQPTNGSLSVTKRALVISAADKTKVYGDANPTFTGSISGVQNGDAVTLSFSTGADATSGVGSYAIVPLANATAAVLANYQTPAITNGMLTVTKAPLSASAADKSKVYGDANPALTGALNGVKNGDPITLSFTTGASAASGIGTYSIVPVINATA